MIPDAPLSALLPDPSYLPPASWSDPLPADIDPETLPSPPLLNNARPAPSRKIYLERVKELSTPNTPAFRTVRRLPPSPDKPAARLGNAYEFFRNLELLSGFWVDTSQPASSSSVNDDTPLHLRVNVRSGTGAQTPPEFRTAILAALVKLVAYDFGCNVALPRVEPRLHLGASTSPARSFPHTSPPTSFPTHITFIYRTPSDRASARNGVVEGPVAALSARHTTAFERPMDELLDLCREVVGVLVTAQQRAREGRDPDEPRRDPDDERWWWCARRRWGGGTGGPIGKEEAQMAAAAEAVEKTAAADPGAVGAGVGTATRGLPRSASGSALAAAVAAGTGAGAKRRGTGRKTMSLYDNYRMVRPPSSTWDRKARYLSIGKVEGAGYDDVFLVSCLNHHVSVSRCRVTSGLLDVLEGRAEQLQEETGMRLWRSRWWDLFLAEERIEAMTAIWGMMAWLMRGEEGKSEEGMEGVETA